MNYKHNDDFIGLSSNKVSLMGFAVKKMIAITFLTLITFECFCNVSVLSSRKSNMIIEPSKVNWDRNWDFKARDLDLNSGYPSSVSTLVQPGLTWLEFYGFLGFFPGNNKLVGFAQIETQSVSASFKNVQLRIDVRTLLPGLKYKVVLAYPDELQECNYQASFEPKKKMMTLSFKNSDFQCFFRGKIKEGAAPLDMSRVTKLRFLITKSSQDTEKKVLRMTIPFNLIIERIEIINADEKN